MTKMKTGRRILKSVAIFTAVGGFLADFNRTHLLNPNWPPHAKFHDAMSICLGFFVGAISLYLLIRRENSPMDLKLATILSGSFWLSMILSFLFPGAGGLEAEFPELVPQLGSLYLNELPFALIFLLLLLLGYRLARTDGKAFSN